MPLSRRLIQPLFTRALTSQTTRQLWRSGHEWLRRAGGRAHRLTLWLQLDDAYSYLLVQMLPRLLHHFPVEPEFRFLQPGRDVSAYAPLDACFLALQYQLSFKEILPPPPADALLATRVLLGADKLPAADFLPLARQIFACAWEHQPGKLATLALRFPPLDDKKAARRWRASPGTKAGVLVYQGERYRGLDELTSLIHRLEALGLNRQPSSLEQEFTPAGTWLVSDPEQLAVIRSRRYVLDYYFSFRDPNSWLGFDRIVRLADHYSLQLRLKAVRQPEPDAEDFQRLLLEAARQAVKLDLPFGRVCLPDETGLRHCEALLRKAQEDGAERETARALLRGIWCEGLDTGYAPHLRRMLEDAGLAVPDLKSLTRIDPDEEGADREWAALDLPALPGLRLMTDIPLTVCGPDRAWAIDMALADTLQKRSAGQAHWARLWPGLA